MWSEGTSLVVGERPWGFRGQYPDSSVDVRPLPTVDTRGLVAVLIPWHELSAAAMVTSPFSGGSDNAARVPLALVELDGGDQPNLRMRVFTCSRLRHPGALFSLVWEGSSELGAGPLEILEQVRANSPGILETLSDESDQTVDLLDGTELEVKYTLEWTRSPWDLATLLSRAAQNGELVDFVADPGNELQRWTYQQSTYEVKRDGVSAGYVGFMLNRSDRYHVKFKLFDSDQLRRLETFDKDVDLDPSEFELYLQNRMPGCAFNPLPLMTRSRFDVLVLSLRTGHFFGLETDQTHAAGESMQQLELEYHETLKVPGRSPETIEPELDRLSALVSELLDQSDIRYEKGYTSKLTWLRGVGGKQS